MLLYVDLRFNYELLNPVPSGVTILNSEIV